MTVTVEKRPMTAAEYEHAHWDRTGSYPYSDRPDSLDAANACCGLCVARFLDAAVMQRVTGVEV